MWRGWGWRAAAGRKNKGRNKGIKWKEERRRRWGRHCDRDKWVDEFGEGRRRDDLGLRNWALELGFRSGGKDLGRRRWKLGII